MITRGDVRIADLPQIGRHAVVVVTRDTAVPVLTSVVCVLVTTTIRGHVAEVQLGAEEGAAPHRCQDA